MAAQLIIATFKFKLGQVIEANSTHWLRHVITMGYKMPQRSFFMSHNEIIMGHVVGLYTCSQTNRACTIFIYGRYSVH